MKKFLLTTLLFAFGLASATAAEEVATPAAEESATQRYGFRFFLMSSRLGVSSQTEREREPQLSYLELGAFHPLALRPGVLSSASIEVEGIPGELFRLYDNLDDHSRKLVAEVPFPEEASDYILFMQPRANGPAHAVLLDAATAEAKPGTVTVVNGSAGPMRVTLDEEQYSCEAGDSVVHAFAPGARQFSINLHSLYKQKWKIGYATAMKAREQYRTVIYAYKSRPAKKQIDAVSFTY